MMRRFLDKLVGRGHASVTVPSMDGALRPNRRLDDATVLAEAVEPDNLVQSEGRLLFSAGEVLYEVGNDQEIHRFSGEISFLLAGQNGAIIAGIDGKGVVRLTQDGTEMVMDTGTARNFTAGCYCGDDLILCEGSSRHAPHDWKRNLMESGADGAGYGSVLRIGPDGKISTIAQGLRWPSGVVPFGPERVLVSESWAHRLLSVDLTSGKFDEVLTNLPGYPSRMTLGEQGRIWLCIFAPRSQLIEFVLREPRFRARMIAELDPAHWIAPALSNGRSFLEPLQQGEVKQMGILKPWAPSRSYGLVVGLSPDGIPQESFHSRADGVRHGVTSVLESGGTLTATSRGNNTVLSIPIRKVGAT